MGDLGSEEFRANYAMKRQYDTKVLGGCQANIRGKKILEIGCGHGGISIFLAVNGAQEVIGIDLNTRNLAIAEQLAKQTAEQLNSTGLPVSFAEVNAMEMPYPDGYYDMIWAENVFEHFMGLPEVLQSCYRILKPGGIIMVPSMPSIYSKYGLHLKNGLKMPWANLFFSEKTICRVVAKRCEKYPDLYEVYPGAKNNPTKVKDLRAYGDLNGITYQRFLKMARDAGYHVKRYRPMPSPRGIGKIMQKIPLLNRTLLGDVFSSTAAFTLEKPKA